METEVKVPTSAEIANMSNEEVDNLIAPKAETDGQEKDKVSDAGEGEQKEATEEKDGEAVAPEKEAAAKKKTKSDFQFDEAKYKGKSAKELIEELKKSQVNAHEKQKIIGRQGKDLGDVRREKEASDARIKELELKAKVPEDEITDAFTENPAQAIKMAGETISAQQELQKEQLKNKALKNKELIISAIPNFDDLIEDMATILTEEDNVPPESIKIWKENPYVADPMALFNLAKRVETHGRLKKLMLENEKLKTSNQNIGQRVQDAIEKSPPLPTGAQKAQSAETNFNFSTSDIAQMKTEDIEEMQKKIREANKK